MLTTREIQFKDIAPITQYWLGSDKSFLTGMGVDLTRLPSAQEWQQMLNEQINSPIGEKKSYCTIWEVDGTAVGHCNINKITMGEQAYMHLHMWKSDVRKKGMGTELVKRSLPFFFEKFKLKKLCCEPYSLNPAPNKTLEKIGFTFIRSYVTVPGSISLEHEVNLWELSREQFLQMK